jgi:hypothetical protein
MSIHKQFEENNNKRSAVQNTLGRIEGNIQSKIQELHRAKETALQELGTDDIDEVRDLLTKQSQAVKERFAQDEIIFNLVEQFDQQFSSGQVSEHLIQEINNTYASFIAATQKS